MKLTSTFRPPHSQGVFGAVRKHDIHTGVDLYCRDKSDFLTFLPGEVVSQGYFTGPEAGSPWWNTTMYVAVYTESLDITTLYGEIGHYNSLAYLNPFHKLVVSRVLKKDKGLPTTMLHVECYKGNPFADSNFESPIWAHGSPKPEYLLDPSEVIPQIRYLKSLPEWGKDVNLVRKK
jgi:hypothetical protein